MDILIKTNMAAPNYQEPVIKFEFMPQGMRFPITESTDFVEEWIQDEPKVVRLLSKELVTNPTWLLAKLHCWIQKWVICHRRQFVELDRVMQQMEVNIQTTTVTEKVHNVEWIFKLFKISTHRIKVMARQAFRNQEVMHTYLCNFPDDGAPEHCVANQWTRATDIRACRSVWGTLRVLLNWCRKINDKWSSPNDTHCLRFHDSPILANAFTYSYEQLGEWYDVEDQEPQQEAFLVGVENTAVKYFRVHWGRKYCVFRGDNNGPGGTYYRGVHSCKYVAIYGDMPHIMIEELGALAIQQNRAWTGLGAGDVNNAF